MKHDRNLSEFFKEGESGTKRKVKIIKYPISGLPAVLFKAMTDSHISHLLQKNNSLASHEAFGFFYESVLGLLDTFTETYKGMNPLDKIEVEECKNINNPVSYFESLYKTVGAMRTGISEGYLLNQVDEIQQLIAHTLYKFKFIK